MGNGITLGLTNGQTLGGLKGSVGAAGAFGAYSGLYGKATGGSSSGSCTSATEYGYGITTDASKSGIKTATHNHNLSTLKAGRYFIRF